LSKFILRYGLVVLLAALVILAVTGNLLSWSPFVIAGQVAALAINVWARHSFPAGSFRAGAEPAAETVVRAGPFRWIRHPMYASALLFIWAAALGHRTVVAYVVAVAATAMVMVRIPLEEKLLRERYPDYPEYVRTTKAVVPFVI